MSINNDDENSVSFCRHCGAEVEANDKFCQKCGKSLIREAKCVRCKSSIPEGAKFCPACGGKVGKSRNEDEYDEDEYDEDEYDEDEYDEDEYDEDEYDEDEYDEDEYDEDEYDEDETETYSDNSKGTEYAKKIAKGAALGIGLSMISPAAVPLALLGKVAYDKFKKKK